MVKCSSQGVPQLVQALMKNLRGPLHHAVYTRLFKVVWGSPATPERPNQGPWPVFKISLHFKRKPRDRAKEWSRFQADPASVTLTFPFTFLSTLLTHPTSRLLLLWVYSIKWGGKKRSYRDPVPSAAISGSCPSLAHSWLAGSSCSVAPELSTQLPRITAAQPSRWGARHRCCSCDGFPKINSCPVPCEK